MTPEDIQDTLRTRPFQPFRMVLTDGTGYEIKHPDLIWLGKRSLMVGLTTDIDSGLYERSVKVDLFHVVRLEPLAQPSPPNGQSGAGP